MDCIRDSIVSRVSRCRDSVVHAVETIVDPVRSSLDPPQRSLDPRRPQNAGNQDRDDDADDGQNRLEPTDVHVSSPFRARSCHDCRSNPHASGFRTSLNCGLFVISLPAFAEDGCGLRMDGVDASLFGPPLVLTASSRPLVALRDKGGWRSGKGRREENLGGRPKLDARSIDQDHNPQRDPKASFFRMALGPSAGSLDKALSLRLISFDFPRRSRRITRDSRIVP